MPFGAKLRCIHRKLGDIGFRPKLRFAAQLGTADAVEERHLRDRTGNKNKLLRNPRGYHHAAEHLKQDAQSI